MSPPKVLTLVGLIKLHMVLISSLNPGGVHFGCILTPNLGICKYRYYEHSHIHTYIYTGKYGKKVDYILGYNTYWGQWGICDYIFWVSREYGNTVYTDNIGIIVPYSLLRTSKQKPRAAL